MNQAWTLMTAMPPTKGHKHLMDFVAGLAWPQRGNVIVATQPGEPFGYERYMAIEAAAPTNVNVMYLHKTLPQDPNSEGFWEMWKGLMFKYGWREGDMFVSSEPYGAKLAEVCGGIFMPYDIERELLPTRATQVREHPLKNFDMIMPEFQLNLRTKVTLFGAESTGKTTLAKEAAALKDGHYLYEYARPYLEAVGPEITTASMEAIWKGQLAAERHAESWYDKPYLFQDTDLFSTVGYWAQPHWTEALGPVPEKLIRNAIERKSDLYVIPLSNIPFETDPIRYGGDHRESPDDYWIALAEQYGLNYVLLDNPDLHWRVSKTMRETRRVAEAKVAGMKYERQFNSSDRPITIKDATGNPVRTKVK